MKYGMSVIALIGVCLLASDPVAAQISPKAGVAADGPLALLTRTGIDSSGNTWLAVDPEAFEKLLARSFRRGESINVDVPMSISEEVTLQLERFEITTPSTKFIQLFGKTSAAMPAPQVVLLRGTVLGEPGSHAYLALTGTGGGSGTITRGSGQRFSLKTASVGGKPSGLVVVPGAGDLPDFPDFCKVVTPATDQEGGVGGPREATSRGPRVLNVAIDADQAYVALFPSPAEAQAYIIQVLGAVTDIYRRDLDLTLVLRSSRLWPNGGEPFGADDISGFRNYWIQNEDLTGLNLVHLFSGRRDTSYGGIAYLASGCTDFGFGISAFMLGAFANPITGPHLWNWDVVVVAHEMGHNLGTPHTHDYSPPIDQCTTGLPQRGTIMSYCHTNGGGLLNTDMSMHTRVADFIANNNPPGNCLWHDCNGNGQNDEVDIQFSLSADANSDGIPDECEDCNGNGLLDPAEIAAGAADVNNNGILDSCELDCNGNGLPDSWEIRMETAFDFNGNGVPDSCEPDCNGNGTPDFSEILFGVSTDVDRNSVPDLCQDCNANGLPDWIDVDREFNVFISQAGAHGSVREYHSASGVFIRSIGTGVVNDPYDIVFGPDRQLYVASRGDHRVVRINVDTAVASAFVAAGVGGLNSPTSLTFGPDGNLYVASVSSILKFHGTTGAALGVFVPAGLGGLNSPSDIAFGPGGNLFVISDGNRILQYHGATGVFIGEFVSAAIGNMNDARAMTFLSNGQLLVTNRGDNRITRYSSAGAFLGQFNDNYPLTAAWSLAIGPNGNVFAARTTSEVRVIEYGVTTGRYLRSFVRGDSSLVAPTSIAFRPLSPNDLNRNGLPDVCEQPICIADVAPAGGDGMVGVGDLLAVINAWGPCPPGCLPYCHGDITFDCTVNVGDLLAVINGWGPCR